MAAKGVMSPRLYTPAEKIALAREIERRFRAGEGSLKNIARELGTCEASFYNWTKAGIKAARPAIGPYSPTERERLVAEAIRLRGEGQSLRSACQAVGISGKSSRKWQADAAPPPVMRPVEVTSLVSVAPPAQFFATASSIPAIEALILSAPGGYRIEGLGIQTAAALLRALA